MTFGLVQNRRQALDLCDQIKEMRLPFKYGFQDIYPTRSVDLNDYLWGFIYNPVADFTGHTPLEVHEAFKALFNWRYDFIYNKKDNRWIIDMGIGSTATISGKELWDYALKVRAFAELELHLTLHLPKEVFIPELNFEHENSNELRTIG